MKEKKGIIIGISLIFLIVIGAYLFENVETKQGLSSATIIKITEKGKVIAFINTDILKQLMEKNVQEDNESIGPSLLLTMNAAGVSEFSQVEVKGKGDKKSIVLNKKDINDDLVLFLSGNNTINLCRKEDNSNFLIKEVTEISVRN